MSWSQDFCLACDRQTDGSLYCGESCRLAEYEKANSPSESSSPSPGGFHLSTGRTSFNFYLPPAFDFSPYRSKSISTRPHSAPTMVTSKSTLTPSSSQSSLLSMQSVSSTSSSESMQLSESARRELRGYASSFDQSRYARRQSH